MGRDRGIYLLDGHNLALPQGTGIATYARGLAQAVAEEGFRPGVLFGEDPGRPTAPGRLGGAARLARRLAGQVEIAWRDALPAWPVSGPQAGLPEGTLRLNGRDAVGRAHLHLRTTHTLLPVRLPGGVSPAAMHWTFPTPLEVLGVPNLYSVLDLIPLVMPETTLTNHAQYSRMTRLIAERAAHIVTISEWSRADIIRLLGVDPSRVTNTWLGVEPDAPALAMPPDALAELLRTRFGLAPQGYFLFYAAIEPRKNLRRLIEAHLSTDIAAPLIIAGKKAWLWEAEIAALAGREGTPDGRVRLLGHLPRGDLMALVRGARAVCFPSLYEGFGLPAVEAMALGAPVLTSTASCMPEIVADAAMCVDPLSVAALAQGLLALDRDADLRRRLSSAGPARADFFSPARYAARLAMMHAALKIGGD